MSKFVLVLEYDTDTTPPNDFIPAVLQAVRNTPDIATGVRLVQAHAAIDESAEAVLEIFRKE